MIRNAPAYQMYADDFRVGTIAMSLQERGAYITLLNHQWDPGHVPGGHIVLVARPPSCSENCSGAVLSMPSTLAMAARRLRKAKEVPPL